MSDPCFTESLLETCEDFFPFKNRNVTQNSSANTKFSAIMPSNDEWNTCWIDGIIRKIYRGIESIKIETLVNSEYKLKKPIIVNIIKDEDDNDYIGYIKELNIYSYNSNKSEILQEINDELIDLFEDLSKLDESQLGKYPKNWKKILTEYIE